MSNEGKIFSYGTTASGVRVQRGYYAVDPSGHVVLLPVHSVIKPGWRLAAQADLEPKSAASPVAAPEPSVEIDAD